MQNGSQEEADILAHSRADLNFSLGRITAELASSDTPVFCCYYSGGHGRGVGDLIFFFAIYIECALHCTAIRNEDSCALCCTLIWCDRGSLCIRGCQCGVSIEEHWQTKSAPGAYNLAFDGSRHLPGSAIAIRFLQPKLPGIAAAGERQGSRLHIG